MEYFRLGDLFTVVLDNFQDWVQENTSYTGNVEDYLEYAPLALVYGLNAIGVKGKNNFDQVKRDQMDQK